MAQGKPKNDYEIADRLHSAAIRLLRRLRLNDKASGVGPAQLSALSILVFRGPMSLKNLAEAEQVKPPTMSRVVAGMIRHGLAHQQSNASDRRCLVIAPTEKGIRVLQEGRERRVTSLAAALVKLTPKQKRRLGRSAELILEIAEQL